MWRSTYDYTPLTTTNSKRRTWLWILTFGAAVVVINIIALNRLRVPTGPLDNYQILNNISPVYEGAFAGEGSLDVLDIPSPEERAVVSTLYSDSYVTGVLALAQSLKAANTTARRILLYIPGRLIPRSLCQVEAAGWELYPVSQIPPPDSGRGVYHRFLDQYTKLNIWGLDAVGVKTVIYLDGDMIVRRNFDELWALPFNFAAVPDIYGDKRGFTLSFNAGFLFLRTSSAVLQDMRAKIGTARYNHKDAEQGFLNLYFGQQAVRLPYVYNANLAIKPKSPALWRALRADMRVVHYTLVKPFREEFDADPREDERLTHAALQEKKRVDGGLWATEMGWWESSWRDVLASLDGKC